MIVIVFTNTHICSCFSLHMLFKIIGWILHLILNNNNMRIPIKKCNHVGRKSRSLEHWLDYVAAQTARSDDALERCLCFSFRGRAWHNLAPDFKTFYLQRNELAKERNSRAKNKVMDSLMETTEQGKLMTYESVIIKRVKYVRTFWNLYNVTSSILTHLAKFILLFYCFLGVLKTFCV